MSTLGFEGAGRRHAPTAWKHGVAALFALIGLAIAGLGATILSDLPWKQVLVDVQTRHWPTTDATVLSVSLHEERPFAATGNTVGAELVLGVSYQYSVGGATYDGVAASYSDRAAVDDRRLPTLYRRLDFARLTGRAVPVSYDPHAPASAYLARDFDWRPIAPRAGLAVIALVFGLALVTRAMRSQRSLL
ncbi:DUF3592 domain-containing protein [Mesorhizobium sp. CAU 1741]|uniref:DUF3592 domain-containing protein n=1 Tax=Mesorhizobium sp. CAU 1741 TaxID=3140366 RepID=UPI00325AA387